MGRAHAPHERAEDRPESHLRRDRPVSPAERAAGILTLQSTVGNQAVARVLVQRSPFSDWAKKELASREAAGGLAAEGPLSHFVTNAVAYAKENPDKSYRDLASLLFERVALLLRLFGSSPPELEFRDSGALGLFNRMEWKIYINKDGDNGKLQGKKLSQLSGEELGDAADTIYHEARHSEQFFRIARMLAGKGQTETSIAAMTSIKPAVVAAAMQRPLAKAAGTEKLVEEAESWHDITSGAYREYKEGVQDLSDPSRKILDVATKILVATGSSARGVFKFDLKDAVDETAMGIAKVKKTILDPSTPDSIKTPAFRIIQPQKEIAQLVGNLGFAITDDQAIKLADLAKAFHDNRMDAYKATAHEADAFAVGGRVSAAVKTKVGTP